MKLPPRAPWQFINTTPGELLYHEFVKPMKLTVRRLAKATKIPESRLSSIISGKRRITAETDLRLCYALGLSDGYFLRAQNAHDLQLASAKLGDRLKTEVKPFVRYVEFNGI